MNKHSERLSADSAAKKGNRRTRAGIPAIASTMAMLLLAACASSEPTERVSFPSYQTARASLDKLSKKYGDSFSVPKKAEAKINGSLEAAMPLFKQYVKETVADLTTNHTGEYRMTDNEGYKLRFNIGTSKLDNGTVVDGIDLTKRDKGDLHLKDADAFLYVYHQKNGGVIISYNNQISNGRPVAIADSLDLEGNTLSVFGEVDKDGNFQTSNDVLAARRESFHNDFGDWASPGSDLAYTFDRMNQVVSLLHLASQATQAGHRIS